MTLSTATNPSPALRINFRANILLKVFLEYGILILRGRKTDQAYEDTGVLGRIFSLLKAENEVYECFDYTLLDLHKKGRRHSKITVIIRDNLFYQMNFKMVPDESLENFRISLNPDNASELKRFFVRQTHILITVAEGEENKDLQLLMKKQLEQNDLGHMKVPLTDLYRSGVEREDSPHAFVYGVKKQVSWENDIGEKTRLVTSLTDLLKSHSDYSRWDFYHVYVIIEQLPLLKLFDHRDLIYHYHLCLSVQDLEPKDSCL